MLRRRIPPAAPARGVTGASLAALVLLSALSAPAQAQLGPGSVRVVFPFAPGGITDALARSITDRISRVTGRSSYVENITGSSGHIGMRAVRDAKPDGTTLLFSPASPMILHEHFFGARLTFDPFGDFTPITQAAVSDYAIAVNGKIPVKSISELVIWLKADTSRATYATPGAGALTHFLGLELGRLWGIANRHVPYRGSPPALNDLAAGHVSMALLTTSEFVQFHEVGTVRILGTFTDKASPFVNGIPTMREQGVDIAAYGWYGIYGPARMPPETVAYLNKIIVDTVRDPAVRERLLKLGLLSSGTTPEELTAIQKRDKDFWGPIVKASGFKPE